MFALSLAVVLASCNEFRNSGTGKANFLSIKTTNETGYVFDFYTNDKIFEFFSDSIVWYLAFGGSVQDVDKYF